MEQGVYDYVSNVSISEQHRRDFLQLIWLNSWPQTATCLYEAFEENKSTSRLAKLILDNVPQENFQDWNDKFVRLVVELSDSVEAVVMSEKTIETVQEIYPLLKTLDSTEINEKSLGYYYLVIQLRSVLLNVDLQTLFVQPSHPGSNKEMKVAMPLP